MTTAQHVSLRRAIQAIALLLCGAVVSAACAVDDHVVLADDPGTPAPPPSFTPPPDADAAPDSSPPPQVLLCEGTVCPAPYATCGTTASLHCGTNLSNDVQNCGACGNVCPQTDPATAPRCTNGKCAFDCRSIQGFCRKTDYQDCNGLADDGCETAISEDPANCGKCGNACPDGQHCVNGSCGCAPGKTFCPTCRGEACVDLTNNDDHCGDCGIACPPFDDSGCNPMPANTHYGCSGISCGTIKCNPAAGDCNGDLGAGCNSDGCEVDFTQLSPLNCGSCGNVCKAGEECRDEGGNGAKCLQKCEDSGRTRCDGHCFDLLSDPLNCGNCGTQCPAFGNDTAECHKGICATKCADGFADCDGNPLNGCEVHIADNPLHCGGCGVACNFAGGQPCIDGKCLTVPCDGGVVTK
jgi:hypothetical protein